MAAHQFMSSETTKRIITIDGVKIEVDLRTAKRVEELRVGSRVKILKKGYNEYKVHHGVIIGFDPFEKRPTIIVAYMDVSYDDAKIAFLYYTGRNEDVEMVAALDDDTGALDKLEITNLIDQQISKHELEIQKLRDRKESFEKKFACYWTPVSASVE